MIIWDLNSKFDALRTGSVGFRVCFFEKLIKDLKYDGTAAFKKHLYSSLKLPVFKVTAKHHEVMDGEALVLLREWCEDNRPELSELFTLVPDYRRCGKIKSTYIKGCAGCVTDIEMAYSLYSTEVMLPAN